jgi:subtilisin family serine protease
MTCNRSILIMKKLILAANLFSGFGLLSAQSLAQEMRFRQDHILVKPNGAVSQLLTVHAQLGSQVHKSFPRFGNLQLVKLPPGVSVEEMLVEYQRTGLVEYAEPDYVVIDASTNHANDPFYTSGTNWNMNNSSDADIDAPEGWYFRTSAENVVVAVIESSGVRYTHEDLEANMWTNPGEIENGKDDDGNGYDDDIHGINAYTGSGDPNATGGHGTHVAGIIGAVGNNNKGTVGVAWQVQLMACNYGGGGREYISDAIECINYAIAEGAHIINASWRVVPTYPSYSLDDAIRAAGNHGIIFVAAAGNAPISNDVNTNTLTCYPASYEHDNIVSVAATTKTDGLADYSSYGLVRVDLGAPGGENEDEERILSTFYYYKDNPPYDGYWDSVYDGRSANGTSMAAPHVSGALALMKAQFPNDSYLQLINRLFSSVDPLPGLSGKCQTGGRLNLHKALTSVSSSPRNDDFTNSYELKLPSSQAAITATGNNVDASKETGEPNHAGSSAAKSVWWHWTANSGGSAEISTYGSTFNTRLAVYTGSALTNLTLVASNYATDSCSWSQVNFTATSNTTYRIAVDGYNAAVGSIKLTVRTNSTTSQTTLSFDPGTVQRSSGQFSVRVLGPTNQQVTVSWFSSASQNWTNYTNFTLSGEGVYDYTDTAATNAYRFYRCQIASLKSCNAVGYVDVSLPAGSSMIANPLEAVDNRVCAVLTNVPNGAGLLKWDELNDEWFQTNTFSSTYGWSDTNMTLAPGEGALLNVSAATNQSFVGEFPQGYLINPVPSGWSIRGSKLPTSGGVASGLGVPILEGDMIVRMIAGTYTNFTYTNGHWVNTNQTQVPEPVMSVGESFWIMKPADWEQVSTVWSGWEWTNQTTLRFELDTVQRSGGQFQVRVLGPTNETITLDRFCSAANYWTNYAVFTNSAEGAYDYTDTAATNAFCFYRCQTESLQSCNAVGYVDKSLPAGFAMIANPLQAVDNRVCAVLTNVPDGSSLLKWDEINDEWSEALVYFDGYGWLTSALELDTNTTLAVGEGAMIELPSATNQCFVGEFPQGYLVNPVPSGWSIRASKVPMSGEVVSDLGATIWEGDIVMRWVDGAYEVYAYRNGMWIDDQGEEVSEPAISIGESFWIVKPTDWEQISSVWP